MTPKRNIEEMVKSECPQITCRPDKEALCVLHRLYLETSHYLEAGIGRRYLESMLKDAKRFLEDEYTGLKDDTQ